MFWLAAVFGDKLPANWNRCHHPRHHHMRQRHPHTMHLRHILEPNHMHQRHPQTHNMKDMKMEEDEGIAVV